MINIQLIYRSYKPLHDLYASFHSDPPKEINYVFPKTKTLIRKFYPLYLKYGDLWIARQLIKKAQKIFFDKRKKQNIDVLHYLQMLPDKIPDIPFIVDFEHIIGLANFVTIDSNTKKRIENILSDPLCRKIIPLSYAAKKTLQNFVQNYDAIAHKVEVIYPALPNYQGLYLANKTHQRSDILNLLFVGNSPYKKGLHELLSAFQILEKECRKLHLNIITDAGKEMTSKFPATNVTYIVPQLTHNEIIKLYYLKSDLFVMPTHDDTFGMAMLFALSSGTPVITTKQFACPEIVTSDVNGIFVKSDRLHLDHVPYPNRSTTDKYHLSTDPEPQLVQDLVQKIHYLYHNREKLNELKANANNEFISGGKFSIKTRNDKLSAAYTHCIDRKIILKSS